MGFLVYLILGAIMAWPFTRLLPRVGLSPYFAFGAFVPLGVIVLLYVVALRERT